MCGRYSQQHTPEQIAERFEVVESDYLFEPRYNIAPTQIVPVVTAQRVRRLVGFRWGLVPFWATDPAIGNRMINAKAETLDEKPAFKYALSERRCLIPADGFYEWQKRPKGPSQPLYVCRRDRELFAFAGLWERWKSPQGERLLTCTIITVEPNELIKSVHHRMAAILTREAEDLWLDTSIQDPARVLALLSPYPSDELEMYSVSRAVNTPANEDPSLIEPLSLTGI